MDETVIREDLTGHAVANEVIEGERAARRDVGGHASDV